MNRLERVRLYVKEHYGDSVPSDELLGVDAAMIAEALAIQRSDASADLNKLYRMGALDKIGKKPVRFFPAGEGPNVPATAMPVPATKTFTSAPTMKTLVSSAPSVQANAQLSAAPQKSDSMAFRAIIGANGSIKAQIQLAKTAVSYPPNGLHTLIIGESGVGKSLLAEEMWRYGKESGAFSTYGKKSPPFVLFSCADYADNPQLLLSQLFGHAKGSFSGATENKAGLVERAEGGVLFLDEIHRLSSAGQELLFTLLDKNVYRRLGETTERKSNLMIIGATTEYPTGVLLTTFMRRIPVVIQLPRLSERPPSERLELIRHFLSLEANRLKLPIRASGRVLQILISYDCKANIGSLKNDMKLACAKSYLSYLSSVDTRQDSVLSIDIQDLPQKVYSSASDSDVLDKALFEKGITVCLNGDQEEGGNPDNYEPPVDLYGFVQKRLDSYKYFSMPHGELEVTIGRELEQYYYTATQSFRSQSEDVPIVRPGIVTPAVWTVTNKIIEEASKTLGRQYSKRLSVALAMHIQQFIGRMNAGEIIYNPNLPYIKSQYPVEMDAISAAVPVISGQLNVMVPEDEVGFLAMFLTQQIDMQKSIKVGLVVAAHGQEVASGMAEVANRLFVTNHVHSLNVPLNWDLTDIFKNLCQTVREADQGKGVLVLGDIDSLVFMEDDIQQQTNICSRIVPGASTSLVLEASKLVLISDVSLDDAADIIAGNYKDYANFICNTMLHKKQWGVPLDPDCQSAVWEAGTRDAILTLCHSGIGAAAKVRSILLDSISMTRTMDIIPVGILEEVGAIAKRLGKRLRLIIGSVNPEIEGIPYMEMSKVLTNQGLSEIELFLKGWGASQLPPDLSGKELSREEMIALINSQVDRFVPTLPADKVIRQCGFILREIESRIFKGQLASAAMTRIYLHTMCMFDRLATGDTLPLSDATELIKRSRREDFNLLYSITTSAAYLLDLNMLEAEVCYLLLTLPEKNELPVLKS